MPGQLYVPIVAERDGHDFIGPPSSEVPRPTSPHAEPIGATAIVVADTAVSLLRLGLVARERMRGGVIGITGSVGKTTTKDLLRSCLASTFGVSASERSFNNELGLPLTLLNAPDDVEWVVLEMGARGVGHIARLTEVGRPDVGIVTSVAMAHVEFLGDLDGVARAKSELVTALPPSGVAVLNFDDPRVARMASVSPCPVLGYAVEGEAEVRAESVVVDDELRPRFRMSTPWGTGEVRLALHGMQQVPNALAAAAAALWCGVPFDDVVSALAAATGSPLRMEVHQVPDGPVLVVDCYNANPASTEAALRSMAALPAPRKLALLGLMAELGAETEAEHRQGRPAGRGARDRGGGLPDRASTGRRRCPAPTTPWRSYGRWVRSDAALVKGSRVARLEDVVLRYEGATGL